MHNMAHNPTQFEVRVLSSISALSENEWNSILPNDAGPFLQFTFLSLLEKTGCVGPETGWSPSHLALYEHGGKRLLGAIPLYIKTHSYGEYVFDWSWAEAYNQAGLNYYPKALSAIPFTPVTSPRLLALHKEDKEALVIGLVQLLDELNLSSTHILFPNREDAEVLAAARFLKRESVQFHWQNQGYRDFDSFLASLTMKRRKNIKRERKQVHESGIHFKHIPGQAMREEDVLFFYHCYANTYRMHHSTPYLNQLFFQQWVHQMPDSLHFIVAYRDDHPIASSLLVLDRPNQKAYGRYWGCIEHHPCLHFETAYYQAIEFCIQENIAVLEGGAQGEHKMARGFMPSTVSSYHYLSDQRFYDAVARFLDRERMGIGQYLDELAEHSPLRQQSDSLEFGKQLQDALK
jgi:predicted N-acyltransferase